MNLETLYRRMELQRLQNKRRQYLRREEAKVVADPETPLRAAEKILQEARGQIAR